MDENTGVPYRLDPYRYTITVLFCVSKLVSSMMYSCYSPILDTMTTVFNENLPYVTLGTVSIWLITYAIFGFVANYILDEKGLRVGILAGNLLTIVGLWIRNSAKEPSDFGFIFFGQFIASLGAPFIINAPQKVSATWHSLEKGPFFTAIHSVMGPLGIGLGMGLAQFFVENSPEPLQGLRQIVGMNNFYAIFGTICLAPTFFLFKDKPEYPPSKSAEAQKFSYKESLKSLSQNQNYLKFLIGSGSFYGAFNIISVVLQPIISPYGYQTSDASNLGGLTILFGLFGALIIGNYVSAIGGLKTTIIKLSLISFASTIGIFFILQTGSALLLYLIVTVFGFSTVALLPIFLEFCNEISFPVNEATAGGLFIMTNQFIGFFSTGLVSWILDGDASPSKSVAGIMIILGIQLFGLYFINMSEEELRRTNYSDSEMLLMELH